MRDSTAPARSSKRILPGAIVAGRELTTTTGDPVHIPDAVQLVHLQFRRFAGCPVCNLHLHSLVQRQDEIAAAGIREVVVFHSTAEELLVHTADLPFAVVADPDQRLYQDFGVESAARALLDPRAWGAVVRAVARSVAAILRGQGRAPAASPHGGRLGLPADLLIASSGEVLASKYGSHVYDQWSVDELLELARAGRADRPARGAATL